MQVTTLTALSVALTLASLTSAGTLELVRWVAPGNPQYTTCSPYVTDVYGCTGWGEAFCQSDTGGADCYDCTGVKSTRACGSATVTMNFDTGEISFANNPGDTASCSFGASDIGYPDGSICTV